MSIYLGNDVAEFSDLPSDWKPTDFEIVTFIGRTPDSFHLFWSICVSINMMTKSFKLELLLLHRLISINSFVKCVPVSFIT